MRNHQYVPVCMCVYAQSCLVGTPWTVACQAPLSMEFPREEYWSVLLAFLLGTFHSGIKPTSLASPALIGRLFATGATWETLISLSSVQFSSVAQSCLTLRPHELQHARPPCPSPTPRVHSNSCPSSR